MAFPILNFMSNFIANETMNFDDRELSWLNRNTKNMSNYKNGISKKQIHHNYDHLKLHLCYFTDLLNTKIEEIKRKYFKNIFHKLSNQNDNPKKYWSLLKAVLNGKNIPCIASIYHIDLFVYDIKKKCDLYN